MCDVFRDKEHLVYLFDFEDYRAFIHHQIEHHKTIRGYRTRLATAAGCRLSYLSQVLNSHVQLTPDQAAGLCQFWSFEPERTDYFLALVHLDRASTPALKAVLLRQMREQQERHRENVRRASQTVVLPLEQAALYHASWHRMAVHALVSIQAYRTAQAIAQRLRLSAGETQTYLLELERMSLVIREGELWRSSDASTMTPAASPLSNATHTNWRLVAIERLARRVPQDLHYTSVIALSRKDLLQVRRRGVEFINQVTLEVEQSLNEECVCLLLDLFTV